MTHGCCNDYSPATGLVQQLTGYSNTNGKRVCDAPEGTANTLVFEYPGRSHEKGDKKEKGEFESKEQITQRQVGQESEIWNVIKKQEFW